MAQDLLNLIRLRKSWNGQNKLKQALTHTTFSFSNAYLFDSNADSHRVYGALDENLLLVIATNNHWLQQKLFAAPVLKHILVKYLNKRM